MKPTTWQVIEENQQHMLLILVPSPRHPNLTYTWQAAIRADRKTGRLNLALPRLTHINEKPSQIILKMHRSNTQFLSDLKPESLGQALDQLSKQATDEVLQMEKRIIQELNLNKCKESNLETASKALQQFSTPTPIETYL